MKTKQITKYVCEICGEEYNSAKAAESCESRPRVDSGVKIGDVVKITQGDGTGSKAKVEGIHVATKDWGHYAWERYWHTEILTAKVIDSYGHRQLTFDSYEKV